MRSQDNRLKENARTLNGRAGKVVSSVPEPIRGVAPVSFQHTSRYPEPEELYTAIESYDFINGRGLLTKSFTPWAGALLAIELAGECRLDGRPLPPFVLLGIRERAGRLEIEGRPVDRLLVRFSPAGLSHFSAIPASVLANQALPAERLFPARALDELFVQLKADRSVDGRAALLDRFFLDRYSPTVGLVELIESAAARLCSDPEASVSPFLHALPASLRQCERLFGRLVGLSPRRFNRVARFQFATRRLLDRTGERLTEIALEAGYYDQAHFGREFRRLVSMAPSAYGPCPPPPDENLRGETSHMPFPSITDG